MHRSSAGGNGLGVEWVLTRQELVQEWVAAPHGLVNLVVSDVLVVLDCFVLRCVACVGWASKSAQGHGSWRIGRLRFCNGLLLITHGAFTTPHHTPHTQACPTSSSCASLAAPAMQWSDRWDWNARSGGCFTSRARRRVLLLYAPQHSAIFHTPPLAPRCPHAQAPRLTYTHTTSPS